ncbi:LysR substrate-binding domain-containing protein [Dactylosporangium sp. CA-233914]|uniref:LysR substrate-binding domain-containing protein n=1 Tax=Dactylosporangium sp. CA-233914 TaxID=3239934 RepID=UPI003D8A41B0
MLDVTRMLVLERVAELGSITAAAAALGYTVSAVSQQISKLERDVGQQLLVREARGVSLTDAGRVVTRNAERLRMQLQATEAELAELLNLNAGALRIGTFPTAGSSLIPLLVRDFLAEFPNIELKIISARFDDLVRALQLREVEIALLWDYDWARVDDSSLTYLHLMDDPAMLVVSDQHRLAGRSSVSIAELRQDDWIARTDHPATEMLERLCEASGFRPRIRFRANDYGEVQAMVAVGLGVAIAPRLAMTSVRPNISLVPVANAAAKRRVLVAHLADRRLSPAAQEGVARCLQQARAIESSFDAQHGDRS